MTTTDTKIHSLGCRLNTWEGEVMRDHGNAAGLGDTVIINTCAVTSEAEKQSRNIVRRARRDNPAARIVVTGCAAQIDPTSWQMMDGVDAVIGNHEKLDAATWRNLARRNDAAKHMAVGDIMAVRETSPHLLEGFDSRSRAFVQIQQGCDHRCTFCIIPYGRGNNRSVATGEVIAQIRALAESGLKEVVLTGVDIACWGSDLDGEGRLGALVLRILREIPELPRLRLSSVDPAAIDEDLITAFADETRLMPHLHLSVQHGDDLILKRMKRRHSAEDVRVLTRRLLALRPDIVFGADLIAGFPTETQAAHKATIALVQDAPLTWLHVFPYSPRPGTPAARMPQTDAATIKTRAAELRDIAARNQIAFLQSRVGGRDEILMETGGIGHTRQFARAKIPCDTSKAGTVFPVRFTGIDGDVLVAERA